MPMLGYLCNHEWCLLLPEVLTLTRGGNHLKVYSIATGKVVAVMKQTSPTLVNFETVCVSFFFSFLLFLNNFLAAHLKKNFLTPFHVVDILCKTVSSLQLCMFKSSQWQTCESSHGDPAVQVFNSNAGGCLFAAAERHHSLSKHLPRTVGPFFETLWPRWMIKTDHDNNSYIDQFQDERILSSLGRKLFLVYA